VIRPKRNYITQDKKKDSLFLQIQKLKEEKEKLNQSKEFLN
jgi:hypothetical protein